MPDAAAFLEADNVSVQFGGLTAVDAVSMSADRGEVVGVIGPNGAGKTTLFNALVGAVRATGSVRLNGTDVTQWPVHRRARAGLGRTFQRLELFGSMTVAENLRFATEAGALGERPWRLLRRDRFQAADRADEILGLVGLGDDGDRPAADLPPGSARLLELGRALCADPQMLLLDEPSSGLDVAETTAFAATLRAIVADRGVGIVLVEHDVSLVLALCARLYVLEFGRCIADGKTKAVAAKPEVRAAYLGDLLTTQVSRRRSRKAIGPTQ
ncbi:MAG TPA: ABC transporter ATP-binding protein [Acidimicrobiales bacterium]|nr:ABC transporter ATP-binding protein [Acidimicrobiales bacterium]